MIESLFKVRKDRFKNNAGITQELDLVEEEDRITHRISLDIDASELNVENECNQFRFDKEYEKHEEEWEEIKKEILGEEQIGKLAQENAFDEGESSGFEEEEEEDKN